MRPTTDEYFMEMAKVVSTRATCDRQHVGAVLVRNNRIVATGYNGSPRGMPHCDDAGHDIENGRCIRSIHAEENALLQCASDGVSSIDATLYCTVHPCVRCATRLYQAGVRSAYFLEPYKTLSFSDLDRFNVLKQNGFVLIQFPGKA